jgi:thiaminase/transcriptional activator TenA
VEHPFNHELAAGTLARERFQFYIQQDALYLADFGRALSAMAARATDAQTTLDFIRFADGAIVVERSLHESFFERFGVGEPGAKSPACFTYTHFLLSMAHGRNFETGMAALLPCFWMYREAGHHILRRASANNPYQEWIDTYSGEEYSQIVDQAIDITERLAQNASAHAQKEMESAFVYSARLEWMFWDSAYRLESWPV